jgi:hypothetical protein
MANSLVIDTSKYVLYARILAGTADGPLIWVDSQGRIHVGGGDPGPLRERLQSAIKQIETGMAAVQEAVASLETKTRAGSGG